MVKLIKKAETIKTSEHSVSEFTEYPFESGNLSLGLSKINGEYPETGFDVDMQIEQIWYVLEGQGRVQTQGKEFQLATGDMIYLDKGERYIIEGSLTLVVASSPSWTEEQHLHGE